jgi:hypothetical protein
LVRQYWDIYTFEFVFGGIETYIMSLKSDVSSSLTSSTTTLKAVPGFLTKTYDIFSREDHQEYCGWGSKGDSIVIRQTEQFSKTVLPKYFKHSNFQSFVRQLNMYDFRKTQQDPNHGEFYHPFFKFGRQDLLINIKRKANSKDGGQSKTSKARVKREVYEDEAVLNASVLSAEDDAMFNSRNHLNHNRNIKLDTAPIDNDSYNLEFVDDGSDGNLLSLDTPQHDTQRMLINETDNALLEIAKHETVRSRVEQRLNNLTTITKRLEGENITLKAMLDDSRVKQDILQNRVETVLRALFNLFTKNGKIKGSSITKLLEDTAANESLGSSSSSRNIPVLTKEDTNSINEVCTFLGIQSPLGRQQIESMSSLASLPGSTALGSSFNELGGQELMKLPSFDTGAASISVPKQPIVSRTFKPDLERQSSLDWFRTKEEGGVDNQPLARQHSINQHNNIGLKRSSTSVEDSSSPGIKSKKTKNVIDDTNEHAQQLSLLGRSQNLTLSRIDSIEQVVQALISGGDTPKPNSMTEATK